MTGDDRSLRGPASRKRRTAPPGTLNTYTGADGKRRLLRPRSERRNALRARGLLKYWGLVPYQRRRDGALVKWEPNMEVCRDGHERS